MDAQKERHEVLQQYVSDMLAVNKHIHEAVRRQRDDKEMTDHPEAQRLVAQLESVLDTQIEDLESAVKRLGGSTSSPVKDAVSSALGAVAGMYDKIRSSTASKMLRDDYTALSLAAISYTMLHTTGLALRDPMSATLAMSHLRNLTPIITSISRVIPLVVAHELREDETVDADTTVGPESVRQTQQAWDASFTSQSSFA